MQAQVTLLKQTAGLGMEVIAATPAAITEALGLQLTALVCSGIDLGPEQRFAVTATGLDATQTLVAWLNRLLDIQQAEKLRVSGIALERCTATCIQATVSGVVYDSRLHQRHHTIRAVNFQRALLEPVADGWRARIFFDL